MGQEVINLLIADDEGQTSRRFSEFVQERGFRVHYVQSGEALKTFLSKHTPQMIIADLMLPDFNGISLLDYVKSDERFKETKVIITSRHNTLNNVRECLKQGACDYVVKPFKFEDMFSRLVFHMQEKREVPSADKVDNSKMSGTDLYLHLFELVLKEANSDKPYNEVLFNMTRMLAMSLKSMRCSIIECDESRERGWVRASSDDETMNAFQLNLNRYPEVLHVMNTHETVVIENLDKDPNLAKIKENLKTISFNSMIVSPVYKRGLFHGVVSTRMKSSSGFTDNEITFAHLMSYVISLVLSSQFPTPLELQDAS